MNLFRFNVLSLFLMSALAAQQDRIQGPVDNLRSIVLRGHLQPLATTANDRGPVESAFKMNGMLLLLRPSPVEQQALERLLVGQRNATSATFHKWLTPEQYADSFGASRNDMAALKSWLQSQGFAVTQTARSGTWIAFNGTAGQVRTAFKTEVHRYDVNGRTHYANEGEPSIPAALQGVVQRVEGLSDFLPQSMLLTAAPRADSAAGGHYLAPGDVAAIYDITPLYSAGIDGTGQSIAVIGESDIGLADIQAFRKRFNLPDQTVNITLAPGFPDPGVTEEMAEGDLDVEWAGAVARNATIEYVYSTNALVALLYAIDQNIAPVISFSYIAGCEAQNGSLNAALQQLAQQANAMGITWVASSGDSGAAGCDPKNYPFAQNGMGVVVPASVPEVTAVGATSFSGGGSGFWAPSNDANGASALSYIPESVWNEVSILNQIDASGGGVSVFFPKPAWQSGLGVPSDGYRDVPDISVAGSVANGYDIETGGRELVVGGTSASAPVFASMVALLNHYVVANGIQSKPGLGNINPMLYSLARNSASGAIHDITAGDNVVPCAGSTPGCTSGSFGFPAGPGYDLATGVGSPDLFNVAHGWNTMPASSALVVLSIDENPVYQQAPDSQGNGWLYTLTVTEEAGVGATLTDLVIAGHDYGTQLFKSVNLAPHGSISTSLGSKGLTVPLTRTFTVSGVDANGNEWTQSMSVPFLGFPPQPAIAGASNAASGGQFFAPGMLMSVYGSQLAPEQQIGLAIPLLTFMGGSSATVNGVPAPLWYVSPVQVNLQIPYEIQPGPATLTVVSAGQTATYKFTVSPTAPGIFVDANGNTIPFVGGSRGKAYWMYITGDGAVSPGLPTGSTPAPTTPVTNLPEPVAKIALIIGGVPAQVLFAGIPSGNVGVTQINFVVPMNAPLGPQPLIVSAGGVNSAAANFSVTQ